MTAREFYEKTQVDGRALLTAEPCGWNTFDGINPRGAEPARWLAEFMNTLILVRDDLLPVVRIVRDEEEIRTKTGTPVATKHGEIRNHPTGDTAWESLIRFTRAAVATRC